ncbi:hypothetical protein CR513_13667, partial [Mucuna pruriens]
MRRDVQVYVTLVFLKEEKNIVVVDNEITLSINLVPRIEPLPQHVCHSETTTLTRQVKGQEHEVVCRLSSTRHYKIVSLKVESFDLVYNDASKMSLSYELMPKDLVVTSRHLNNLRLMKGNYLRDYNFDLSHHLGKANVVVNALSRKPLYVYD